MAYFEIRPVAVDVNNSNCEWERREIYSHVIGSFKSRMTNLIGSEAVDQSGMFFHLN